MEQVGELDIKYEKGLSQQEMECGRKYSLCFVGWLKGMNPCFIKTLGINCLKKETTTKGLFIPSSCRRKDLILSKAC